MHCAQLYSHWARQEARLAFARVDGSSGRRRSITRGRPQLYQIPTNTVSILLSSASPSSE